MARQAMADLVPRQVGEVVAGRIVLQAAADVRMAEAAEVVTPTVVVEAAAIPAEAVEDTPAEAVVSYTRS